MTLSYGHYGGCDLPKHRFRKNLCESLKKLKNRPGQAVLRCIICLYFVTVMVSGLDVFHNPSASATVIS